MREIRTIASQVMGMLVIALGTVVLAACGGGGSGGSGSASLSGVAATGAAVDGMVYVIDSTGAQASAAVNPDGSFTLALGGMTPPYLLKAVPNGGGATLYSFASKANTAVNVTPLTSLAVFLAANTDLGALYDSWSTNSGVLTDTSIESEQKVINANLSGLYASHSVDATYYDFMKASFNTDGTGIDGVLDALNVAIDFGASNFSVDVNGSPTTWDAAISTANINIGDFSISDSSSWQLTITDAANNINISQVVSGINVPNDLDEVELASEDEVGGTFSAQGLQITVTLSDLTYQVSGSGEIGTVISGTLRGTVRVTGSNNGQPIDETANLNTQFSWQRLS